VDNGDPAHIWWLTYLPWVIVAIVFALRFKRLSRARPLRPRMMLATPILYVVVIAGMFVALPPTPLGWLFFVAGIGLGALLGWQRARLMHLHVDPDHGKVMVRQSPIALLLILGLVLGRRLLLPHGAPTVDENGLPAGKLLYITDGGFGLALGTLGTQALLLWRRAQELIAQYRSEG
jgi:hypothetical protein